MKRLHLTLKADQQKMTALITGQDHGGTEEYHHPWGPEALEGLAHFIWTHRLTRVVLDPTLWTNPLGEAGDEWAGQLQAH